MQKNSIPFPMQKCGQHSCEAGLKGKGHTADEDLALRKPGCPGEDPADEGILYQAGSMPVWQEEAETPDGAGVLQRTGVLHLRDDGRAVLQEEMA